jgi:hypothetical protein
MLGRKLTFLLNLLALPLLDLKTGGSIASFVEKRKNTPTLLITGRYGQAFSAWVGRKERAGRRRLSRVVVALVLDEKEGVLESANLGGRSRSEPSLHSPVLSAEWVIHNRSGAFAQIEGSSIRYVYFRRWWTHESATDTMSVSTCPAASSYETTMAIQPSKLPKMGTSSSGWKTACTSSR